jgi:hypothetical protein
VVGREAQAVLTPSTPAFIGYAFPQRIKVTILYRVRGIEPRAVFHVGAGALDI